MSDPMTSPEIEDVLSSIRRLVSDDLRPRARAQPGSGPSDKLLLTPALRIVEDGPDAARATGDATAMEGQPALTPDEVAVDRMAEAIAAWHDDDSLPERSGVEEGSPNPAAPGTAEGQGGLSVPMSDAGSALADDAPYILVADDVTPQSRDADVLYGAPPPGASWSAPRIEAGPANGATSEKAVPPAPVPHRGGSMVFRSRRDGDAFRDDGMPPEATAARNGEAAAGPSMQDMPFDPAGQIAAENPPLDLPETLGMDHGQGERATTSDRWTDVEAFGDARSDPAVQPDDAPAMVEVSDDAFGTGGHEAPGDGDMAWPSIRPDETAPVDEGSAWSVAAGAIDEAALTDLVREMIRAELQGALGERITRNVRKLVRAEIQRVLSTRDIN